MRKHVTVVGALFIGDGVLMVVAALFVALFLSGIGLIPLLAENEELPMWILASIGSAVGLLLLVLGVPGIIGGIGVLRMKPWARVMVLILAALKVPNMLVGTAIGAYTLWALTTEETVQLFGSEGACC